MSWEQLNSSPLNTSQVRKVLSVSRPTLNKMTRQKMLFPCLMGGENYYSKKHVAKLATALCLTGKLALPQPWEIQSEQDPDILEIYLNMQHHYYIFQSQGTTWKFSRPTPPEVSK